METDPAGNTKWLKTDKIKIKDLLDGIKASRSLPDTVRFESELEPYLSFYILPGGKFEKPVDSIDDLLYELPGQEARTDIIAKAGLEPNAFTFTTEAEHVAKVAEQQRMIKEAQSQAKRKAKKEEKKASKLEPTLVAGVVTAVTEPVHKFLFAYQVDGDDKHTYHHKVDAKTIRAAKKNAEQMLSNAYQTKPHRYKLAEKDGKKASSSEWIEYKWKPDAKPSTKKVKPETTIEKPVLSFGYGYDPNVMRKGIQSFQYSHDAMDGRHLYTFSPKLAPVVFKELAMLADGYRNEGNNRLIKGDTEVSFTGDFLTLGDPATVVADMNAAIKKLFKKFKPAPYRYGIESANPPSTGGKEKKVAEKKPKGEKAKPKKKNVKASVVFWDVDTQVDFMLPAGKLYVPGAVDLIPNLKKITKFIQKKKLLHYSTLDVHVKDDPEFKHFPPHCIVRTNGVKKIPETIVDAALDDKQTVKKATHDVFSEAKVMDKIVAGFNAIGIKTIIIYGVATDYCVATAALGFASRGFKVVVIKDAVAGVGPATTEHAIADMKEAGVKFKTFGKVVEMLSPGPKAAAEKTLPKTKNNKTIAARKLVWEIEEEIEASGLTESQITDEFRDWIMKLEKLEKQPGASAKLKKSISYYFDGLYSMAFMNVGGIGHPIIPVHALANVRSLIDVIRANEGNVI